MFDTQTSLRVYGLPPGADFPDALVKGLINRTAGQPPEALARVRLIVNTRRMMRRIRDIFDAGPATLIPQMHLVTDLGELADLALIPPAVSPLRRRLELVQLVSTLLDRQPDLAPRATLFDLADSLANLMDEMHGEGVLPDQIMALDVSDQSGHWDRAKQFLTIVQRFFGQSSDAPDIETRQRVVILGQIARWQTTPPTDPIILAGSTGSRGSTHLLMQAIAQLPQGAVVLPGYDFDTPPDIWPTLDDAMSGEDHPQYRFHKLMQTLKLSPDQIAPWSDVMPPNPARNRVISLALRPAPVTDQWLAEGPHLRDMDAAFAKVTMIEASSTRQEALAIAMRLRQAVEMGQSAALITPDRMITRQVTAALDSWNITPDDSAGRPLQLSATGRFLRHVSALFTHKLTAEALMTLLKHPLTHSGENRGAHLLLARELELSLRRYGPPYPTADSLQNWADKRKQRNADANGDAAFDADTDAWAHWVATCFVGHKITGAVPLEQLVSQHVTLADQIAQGSTNGASGALWQEAAGRKAQQVVDELIAEAKHGGPIDALDYHDLFNSILSKAEVRNQDTPHPLIRIWGTLEARVQGADLLILAGLNEGSWPTAPTPDPWLNRKMRVDAGLLLPERRIGLSAHDFQQAVAANEVWLTRSVRSDDAETVPSRWLNRLLNLLGGLPQNGGLAARDQMRARGRHWLALARKLDAVATTIAATRPAPCPPAAARPKRLSVTEIKHLVRDPYAIYAKHVLRLRPLDPLMQAPDALLRGTVLHKVFEHFIKQVSDDPAVLSPDALLAITREVLDKNVPWSDARVMWLARIARIATWFVQTEHQRHLVARPVGFETKGQAEVPDLGFTLVAKADRIDRDSNGHLHIYDYKTGALPTAKQQKLFDKQLLLEAAISELAGFEGLGPATVAQASYIGIGASPNVVAAPLQDETIAKIWSEFHTLISAYLDPAQPFVPRRMMHSKDDISDYDQLSRYGEWDTTDAPKREVLE